MVNRKSGVQIRPRRKKSEADDSDDEDTLNDSRNTLSPPSSLDSPPTSPDSSSSSSPEETKSETDDIGRNYRSLPSAVLKDLHNGSKSIDDEYLMIRSQPEVMVTAEPDEDRNEDGVQLRRKSKLRRSRLQRRCSINGHFYNRETSVFKPATGSMTSVWVTSLVTTSEVINMMLDKFKVTNEAADFAIYVISDNGECRRIPEQECPLITRVMLGPNEDVAKVYVMTKPLSDVSAEMAAFINLSQVELDMFLRKFEEEENKEILRVRRKYDNVRKFIKLRLKEIEAGFN